MKTPFAHQASRLGNRSTLLLAVAATILAGCGGSGTPDNTITKAPTITSQPNNVGAIVGGTATFSVSASGRGLSYQWYRGNSPISGATSSSFTINPVTNADFGTYSVRVINDAGETTSGFATLALPSTGAPTITTQPVSVATTSGSAATFSVDATGTGDLTYQWYRNGTAISGATGSSYSIPSVSSGNTGSYYVIITNSKGSTTSNTVTLTIVAPSAPTIRTQPVSKTVPVGNNTSFSVVASGSPTLTYQWYKNDVAIPGATSSTYAISGVDNGDAGDYKVVVTNSLGSATSNVATLAIAVAPTITEQTGDQTRNAGESVTFSVVASGTAPLTYQWYKNATLINGATGPSYTINNVTANSAGEYKVVVSNPYGSDTSDPMRLTVIGPPSITQQPVSVTVGVGSAATFTVAASGTGSLTYQWYKNGAAISGATGTSYTTPATVIGDNGAQYYVRVTNGAGTTQSNTVTLTVRQAPTITSQPTSLTVTEGQSATFNVTATGSGTLTYQWFRNGALISGATSSSYTIPSTVKATDNGASFFVRVYTDGLQDPFAQSNTVTLTVN